MNTPEPTTPEPTTGGRAGRRPTFDVNHVVTAATAEALALGHPEVDVDHLLVGLLVAGGPSARALVEQGGDLAAARRAAREEQEDHLRALGLDADGARPPEAGLRAAARTATRPLPLNGRAAELLTGLSLGGGDQDLLRAMVGDRGGLTGRLLERMAIDPEALLRGLAQQERVAAPPPAPAVSVGASAGATGAAALGGPPPAGATWVEVSREQSVPVPPERLWALLDDPHRRAEWDATATDERRASTHTLVRREPAGAIAWLRHDEGSSHDSDQVLQVLLRPDGPGTHVRVERAWVNRVPTRGARWRLARPLITAMVRAQVRSQIHQIAQAA